MGRGESVKQGKEQKGKKGGREEGREEEREGGRERERKEEGRERGAPGVRSCASSTRMQSYSVICGFCNWYSFK